MLLIVSTILKIPVFKDVLFAKKIPVIEEWNVLLIPVLR